MLTRNEIIIAYKLLIFSRAGLVMTRRMLSDCTGLSKYKVGKACNTLLGLGIISIERVPYRPNNHAYIYEFNLGQEEFIKALYDGQF